MAELQSGYTDVELLDILDKADNSLQRGEVASDSDKFGGFTPQQFRESITGQITVTPPSGNIAVLVNQIGYDVGRSKRATIPNAPNGTVFFVINSGTNISEFFGVVQDGIADFSSLNPSVKTNYYIRCLGVESFEFTISKNLMQLASVMPALDFMDQSRQDSWETGSNTGYGWRDGHQFSFELNSMVLQYMANPAYYDSITNSIHNVDKTEYPSLQTQMPGEPNLVWLIKFGAMRYYDWGKNRNVRLHMLIKGQLAYFLYIYPAISEWVDESFYKDVRDFTIGAWGVSDCSRQWHWVSGSNHNLFALQTLFGGLKGSQPPAHSIIASWIRVYRRLGSF